MISISIAAVRIPSLSLPDRPLIKSSLPACPAVLPIEQRIVSKFSHLIWDANDHRIYLGNWATCQLRALDSVLIPEESAGAIRSIIFDLREILIARCNTISKAWGEASYLLVVQNAPGLSSIMTRAARLYKPCKLRSRYIGKGRFYAVRVCHHPGVRPKRLVIKCMVSPVRTMRHFRLALRPRPFKTATPLVPTVSIPGEVVSIFMDGSASTEASFAAGCGVTLQPWFTKSAVLSSSMLVCLTMMALLVLLTILMN